ncbi:uncharacterized protein LOC113321545 [Papaver somniferum]|uniref:uncharacterized protein LOC113321545 n=1 Tax=Papaver somniferum TaxID=3469 RepID=UPI000E6FCB7A|nr:uncharacterized protein LOC113321545 [Papaver somniferum]XP_026425228.1 uncharacterized protein LOC113321545 [Papaver somniferum]
MAAYVPPHKRYSKDGDDNNRPLPTQFQMNVASSSTSNDHARKRGFVLNMPNAVFKWFIESDDDDISIRLVLVDGFTCLRSTSLGNRGFAKNTPWVSITERIGSELLASFANVRSAMDLGEAGSAIKPTFVARVGQIHLLDPPDNIISSCSSSSKSEAETAAAHVKKHFCTNLPDSYMEAILGGVAPKIVADLYHSKEYYQVLVSDKRDPKSGIIIKCQIICGELKIQKIEKNPKKCFIANVTCLDRDLDLRLRLAIKRDLTAALKDDSEEIKGLKHFVDSAILDGSVKGGLRWPLGKEHSSEGRYSIIKTCHSTVKTFKNSSIKLRLKNEDWFNFCISDGEVENELVLDMKGINDTLIDKMLGMEPAIERLQETLKLVWNHLLCFEL